MKMNEYQNKTRETAIYPMDTQLEAVSYCTLGLASEAGEIAGKLKKIMRDDGGTISYAKIAAMRKEIGDVLWYVSELATSLGISLEHVARSNIAKLQDRQDRGVIGGSGDNR